MSGEARFNLIMRFPWAAMALLDLCITSQWLLMWHRGAARSQSVIGWCALAIAAALWSVTYSTITPGQRKTVIWSRLTVVNALAGLLTVLWLRGDLVPIVAMVTQANH